MISSLFLRGSTWQTSLFPSDQAMKTPHFEQSPFWKWKCGLPQLLSAQWVPGLKNKRPERTPQKVINDRYVLIFALYCQLTHWKTSCRTCTSGKYFPMAPYRHRGSAGIQSFHLAFAGSKVKVILYGLFAWKLDAFQTVRRDGLFAWLTLYEYSSGGWFGFQNQSGKPVKREVINKVNETSELRVR